MALDKQINIYSVDTSAFYDSYESSLNQSIFNLIKQIKRLDCLITKYSKQKTKQLYCTNERYNNYIERITKEKGCYEGKLKKEKGLNKAKLISHFEVRKENSISNRFFRKEYFREKNIISLFSSSLTRSLGLNEYNSSKVYKNIIVVRVYYFQVLEDLIHNGFFVDGEKYIYFSSSAGNIRTKKAVFIKESDWNKNEMKIMCGLTINKINEKGGMNINKFLAYKALASSATEVWEGFDIDKSIVVEDFETPFVGEVDYINHLDYTIERKTMPVMIPHTDGVGLTLEETAMIRAPHVKGLMVNCPFDKFVKLHKKTHKGCQKVKDIYGVEHDILKEGIKYIFTKSQFKMWKYYDSWEQYKELFKLHQCEVCKCNEEEDEIDNSNINYQMMQQLTDMTDGEILQFAHKSVDELRRLGTDKDAMLSCLGVSKVVSQNTTSLQKALHIYPELLQTHGCKETIKQTKASIEKDIWSAKVKVEGKYTFVSPDVYAFMEWLFLKIEEPKGLLETGEVSCSMFEDGIKVDCLRAPSLMLEHAVRTNRANKDVRRWFTGNTLYTSTRDLISKILQFDCDGDKLLVVSDPLLVEIAERNIVKYEVAPLYYEMSKAKESNLDGSSFYNGLTSAFTGGNIGIYSNNISKIWNMFGDNVEENKRLLDLIKILCMENNFVIDYAKTLFKPTRPHKMEEEISQYTSMKLPAFFKYAKDKGEEQVVEENDSVVNRFKKLVPKQRILFKSTNLGKFDYRMLLSDVHVKFSKQDLEVFREKYDKINRSKKYLFNDNVADSKLKAWYSTIKTKKLLLEVEPNEIRLVDLIVTLLFADGKSLNSNTLWNCFGNIVVSNLSRNVPQNTKLCEVCGKRFEYNVKAKTPKMYCYKCEVEIDNKKARDRAKKLYLNKKIQAS